MFKVDIVDKVSGYECGKRCDDQEGVDSYYSLVLSTGILTPNKTIVAESEIYSPEDVISTDVIEEVTYVTIRQHSVVITDITDENARKERIQAIAKNGDRVKGCCDEIRSYIAGYNLSNFTHEEIDAMLVTFGSINTALINMRITEPRTAIAAITPSGAITQELLDDLAYIYTKWGFSA